MYEGSNERKWTKSRRCETNACVEVAIGEDGASMRRTGEPEAELSFDRAAWQDFVDAIKDGEFDQ